MSETVQCVEHGKCAATAVCCHVVESLADGERRGFWWSLDEENEYSAVCSDCDSMPADQWEREQDDLGRVLCFGCFQRVARLNGVALPGIQ